MPFDQPSSSTGDCEFSNAITAAVLAEIAAGGVPAIANELSPQATDPFGGLFVIWLLNIGRFCLTVRTGRYALHEDSWRLDTGAESERVPSPLAQAWDEAVLVSRTIHRKLLRRVMIAPAVAFPDTMPDARIRRVAQRSRVVVVWDLDDLASRLADAAVSDPQRNPPTREQAEEEVAVLADPNTPPTGPPI